MNYFVTLSQQRDNTSERKLIIRVVKCQACTMHGQGQACTMHGQGQACTMHGQGQACTMHGQGRPQAFFHGGQQILLSGFDHKHLHLPKCLFSNLTQIVNSLLAIKDLNFTNIQIQDTCPPPLRTPMCTVYSRSSCRHA